MSQESCKMEKDETDCEILKPSAPSVSPSSSSSPIFSRSCQEISSQRSDRVDLAVHGGDSNVSRSASSVEAPPHSVRYANRCSTCQRKVGLTGFRCRCGDLFCGKHRYSDTHDCLFDYKAAAREQISKANPVIKAAKIIKI